MKYDGRKCLNSEELGVAMAEAQLAGYLEYSDD
jgi:hypothetical protein